MKKNRKLKTGKSAKSTSPLQRELTREGITLLAPFSEKFSAVLTAAALRFTATLIRQFRETRQNLLQQRTRIQKEIRQGKKPEFLNQTSAVRSGVWNIAPIRADLLDRRVEITGPAASRKMVINALNSGAKTFMADTEDSECPTWENVIQGQINLKDAVTGTITHDEGEKHYRLIEKPAVLIFRPRGWHLLEKHVLIDGKPVSASIFDFALYFFHNAKNLIAKGSGPYFYLPKLEHYREARLWNHIFILAQSLLGLPLGTIKATVLIETILGAFHMEEILFELRDHSAGLNCGRWDYIFSFIKKFSHDPNFVLPDRALVTMDKGFLAAYVNQVIKICHRRKAHAIGGMAAQIPIKSDPEANTKALEKVRADKLREVRAGHDGTWVAHPGLVPIALEIFNAHMPTPNQIHLLRDDVQNSAEDLLRVPAGEITENGLRTNIQIGIRYLEAWLRGTGCVPLNNLMEDAATAEISRAQVWQWVKHRARLTSGIRIDLPLIKTIMREEMGKIKALLGESTFSSGKFPLAEKLFNKMVVQKEFPEFLTLEAYKHID